MLRPYYGYATRNASRLVKYTQARVFRTWFRSEETRGDAVDTVYKS